MVTVTLADWRIPWPELAWLAGRAVDWVDHSREGRDPVGQRAPWQTGTSWRGSPGLVFSAGASGGLGASARGT